MFRKHWSLLALVGGLALGSAICAEIPGSWPYVGLAAAFIGIACWAFGPTKTKV